MPLRVAAGRVWKEARSDMVLIGGMNLAERFNEDGSVGTAPAVPNSTGCVRMHRVDRLSLKLL